MDTELEKQLIEKMLHNFTTNGFCDGLVQSRILKLYKNNPELYNYTRNLILGYRKNWVSWYFNTQREWQERKSINKNHDSFELREYYIGIHSENSSEFIKKARNYNRRIRPQLFVGRNY